MSLEVKHEWVEVLTQRGGFSYNIFQRMTEYAERCSVCNMLTCNEILLKNINKQYFACGYCCWRKNPEYKKYLASQSYKRNFDKNQENNRIKNKYYLKKRKELKLQIINHYTKGVNCCQCCGVSHELFLNVDHINNNGAQHRKEIGGKNNLYAWIVKNSFPDGFQILCFNCNLARQLNGGVCPHKTKMETP